MAKRILFIRHGESESNAGGKTEHPQTINLTDIGREQARDKAAALDFRPDLIVTSSFIRTKQTAEPFVERFPNVPTDEWNIQEFTFLAVEKYMNTTNEERKPDLMAFWTKADPDHRDGDSSESFNEFVGRCRDAIEKMKSVEGDTVLVFCHGYTMNCIRYILEGKFDEGVTGKNMLAFWDYHAENKIENCETMEFAVDGDKVSLVKRPPAPPRKPGKTPSMRTLD
jgi:broad specificity phosphatase PhoE